MVLLFVCSIYCVPFTSFPRPRRRLRERHFKRLNLEETGCEITANLTLVGGTSVRSEQPSPVFLLRRSESGIFRIHGGDASFDFPSLVLPLFPARCSIPGPRLHIRPDHNYRPSLGSVGFFPFSLIPPLDSGMRGGGGPGTR